MPFRPITAKDRELIAAARETLRRRYRPHRHTVAAALRTSSGRVYTSVDVEATPHAFNPQNCRPPSRAAYNTMLALGAKLGDSSSEPGDSVLQRGEPSELSIIAIL